MESDQISKLKEKVRNGDAKAQCDLGTAYHSNTKDCMKSGIDRNRDYTNAVYWFSRSAAQGLAEAQYKLGQLCENGDGVEKDVLEAEYWYNEAATNYPLAQEALDRLNAN